MNKTAFVLLLALSQGLAGAQSLRPSPQLSGSRFTSGPQEQGAADYIVAVVNSEPITNNEVRARMLRAERQLTERGAALPPRDELAKQQLERLISERAQIQYAAQSGVKVDESSVEQAVRNVAQQNQVDPVELRRRVEASGLSWTQFRSDLRDQILLMRLREREVEPTVKVAEGDIDQFIREQQDTTNLSEVEINLAQVLVAVPEQVTPEQLKGLQERAQRVLDRARAGEDFSVLVREFSDAPDRVAGGVLGLRTADRYPSLFVDATLNLKVGAVAALVRSGAGFHILKLLDKKRAGLPSVNVTQTHASHILLRPSAQLSQSAAVARLTQLKKEIEGGADFATLARANSQDGSARDGGDLGWANPGQFVPEFEEAMNGLQAGEVSDPVVSRFGVHLIRVDGRRESTLSERQQREIARNLVREKKLDEAYNTWAQNVRGSAYVEYREPPR